LSPPAGSGAVQLAWGATGEIADWAVIRLEGEILFSGRGIGWLVRPGAPMREGGNDESRLRACFFYFERVLEMVFGAGLNDGMIRSAPPGRLDGLFCL
jgi:hypothetical protein